MSADAGGQRGGRGGGEEGLVLLRSHRVCYKTTMARAGSIIVLLPLESSLGMPGQKEHIGEYWGSVLENDII